MNDLRGTPALIRLGLRLDRVRLPIWIVGIVALILVSASSVLGLYETPDSQLTYAALAQDNPTFVVVNGPGFGLEHPSVGAIFVTETTIWGALTAALMSVFIVLRHTRAEEEAERTDILRARMVGRHAPLAAAVSIGIAANLVIGVASVIGLAALGLPAVGSVAASLAMAAAGIVFTGAAAVAAQLTSSNRGALGWGVGAVGAAYALRAAGDLGSGALSWASPLGWVHRVRPFAGERWWVLGLSLLATVALVALAARLSVRRDLGAGLVAPRLGPAHASAWTSHPLGLVLRLQRGAIIGWSIGLFTLGLLYGGVARDVEQMLADNPDLAEYFAQVEGASILDSYLAYTLLLGAMLTSGFAVASVLRQRTEEATGRTELVLSTPLPRHRWIGGHVLIASAGALVILLASGLGTGIGVSLALDDPSALGRLTWASATHLPAVLVLVGVAVALDGIAPRFSLGSWGVFAGVLVIGLLAELLGLPGWVRGLSPFEHSSGLPAADWSRTGPLGLSIAAALLVVAGIVGFGRRDVPAH